MLSSSRWQQMAVRTKKAVEALSIPVSISALCSTKVVVQESVSAGNGIKSEKKFNIKI